MVDPKIQISDILSDFSFLSHFVKLALFVRNKIHYANCCYFLTEWNCSVKPGLHTSRKDRKHMFANTFLKLPGMAWSPYSCNDSKCCDLHKKYLQPIFSKL